MDMSGMDMSGGMDDNQWAAENARKGHDLWYLVAASVGAGLFLNAIAKLQAARRIKVANAGNELAARPTNLFSQCHATFLAVCREATYPMPWTVPRMPAFNPLPLGRLILLLTYWLVILCLLFVNSIISGAYYYEKIAFRAAWISVSQVPLIFLLSSKNSVVGWLVNSSHERLNWMHRWVSRTLLITVTIHFAFFFREWWLADFVSVELAMMPMVKYGLISYGVLGWIVISSFLPIRSACYELFVLQHIVSGIVFIWAVHSHVPSYAAYNVWMAVGFWVFDRAVRSAYLAYNNLRVFHLRGSKDRTKAANPVLTCTATLEGLGGVTRITIPRPPASWKPGQHVFLQLPTIAPFSSHPFTVCSLPSDGKMQFVARAHSGFTRRLLARATSAPHKTVPAIIDGPYGAQPAWTANETLVLIAGATGASFTVPVLRSVLAAPGAVRRIVFCWVVKQPGDIAWYEAELQAAVQAANRLRPAAAAAAEEDPEKSSAPRRPAVELDIRIFVSCGVDAGQLETPLLPLTAAGAAQQHAHEPAALPPAKTADAEAIRPLSARSAAASSSASSDDDDDDSVRRAKADAKDAAAAGCCCTALGELDAAADGLRYEQVCIASGRPPLRALVDEALQRARGETRVAVCGPPAMNAEVRNAVASLSDERAVSKGSGALGVALWVEGFGW